MVYWEPIMSLTQDSQAQEPNFGGMKGGGGVWTPADQ